MRLAVAELRALGPKAVLLKGGHLTESDAVDIFEDDIGRQEFRSARVATKNTHGTGCTLSAAIAAFLGQGLALPEAARHAKDYISLAIAAADRLDVGGGHGPVHHFHALWPNGDQAINIEGADR